MDEISNWEITSAVPDIFQPKINPSTKFIRTVNSIMNSNTVLLKGKTDNIITDTHHREFFSVLTRDMFTKLFLEFDRLIGHCNYHEWIAPPQPDDYYAECIPSITDMMKPNTYKKLKPMSYLGFVERLHWMLLTGPNYYNVTRPTDMEVSQIIHDLSKHIFGQDTWTIKSPLPSWKGLPNWIDHPWSFYDVVPDFLNSTGYWDFDENPPGNAYFDGGTGDSCTLFFNKKTFYVLLTNACP